jgi:plastocyanin
MWSFNRVLVLGAAALALLAVMVSPAAAQRFRTFASPFVNRVTPFRPAPFMTFRPVTQGTFTATRTFTPSTFTITRTATPTTFAITRTATPTTFTTTRTGTPTMSTTTRSVRTAPSMAIFPSRIASAARLYSRQNLGHTFNPYLANGSFLRGHGYFSSFGAAELAALSNRYGLNGLGYNPYLSTMAYGGGFGAGYGAGGYGGGGYGGGNYGGVDYQSPYLAASYQNPSQDSGIIQAAAPADPNPHVEVNITDDSYQPRSITISAGTIVTWENVGSHIQTVTSDTGIWDSQELDPGRPVSVFFARPGTYTYRSTLHPDKLHGTVIVERRAIRKAEKAPGTE